MYQTDFWTLWEKVRVGWSERTASKHVYYQVWNRSPVQVGCMRQVLRADALRWPRGMGWGERWEGGLGWETHVNPWLLHVNVWQKPLWYCKVIGLQIILKKWKKWTYKKCLVKSNQDSVCCFLYYFAFSFFWFKYFYHLWDRQGWRIEDGAKKPGFEYIWTIM